jgi:hypothetical protein
MKTILFAGAMALGLSTGAAFASTSSGGYLDAPAMPAASAQAVQQHPANTGEARSGIATYATTRTRPNPTGQTQYGPHGEISLWQPDATGGGDG